jgi:betaine lipid synthase
MVTQSHQMADKPVLPAVRQYLIDTLDPLGRNLHLRKEGYHYYLTLMAKYHPESPPMYLSRSGFAQLKAAGCQSLESFRLHTDSLYNVIRNIEGGALDVWIGMDHMSVQRYTSQLSRSC